MKLHLVLWLSVMIGAMGTPAWADPPSNPTGLYDLRLVYGAVRGDKN